MLFSFSLSLAFAAITVAGADPSAATTQPTNQDTAAPDYSAFTQSYHIPFANRKTVDFNDLKSLHVRASINGGPIVSLDVDTGSIGVIIGAGDVPHIDPNAPAGSMVYFSSGVELDGVWTPATITFVDSKDENGKPATAVIPVLAAKERQFHAGAVNGGNRKSTEAPVKNPKVFMLGIGFGRGKEPFQERNAWTNLKEMQAGTMRRGYQITPDGITLGLTAANVGSGYLFEKLTPRTAAPTTGPVTPQLQKDWNASQGWITIGGKKQHTSSMLLDTGLTNLMIEYPEVTDQLAVQDGTDITVSLLSGKLSYSFKTGDTTNPYTPRKVTWVHRDGGSTVNTGIRALAGFDYLYDADGGYLGLRPRQKAGEK
jgi:hypothetical protein